MVPAACMVLAAFMCLWRLWYLRRGITAPRLAPIAYPPRCRCRNASGNPLTHPLRNYDIALWNSQSLVPSPPVHVTLLKPCTTGNAMCRYTSKESVSETPLSCVPVTPWLFYECGFNLCWSKVAYISDRTGTRYLRIVAPFLWLSPPPSTIDSP